MLALSRHYKMAAKPLVMPPKVFLTLRDVYPGCCTVAAHEAHPAGLGTCDLPIRSPNASVTSSDPISNCKAVGLRGSRGSTFTPPLRYDHRRPTFIYRSINYKTAVWRRLPARLPHLPGGFQERPFVAAGDHDAGSFGGHREGDGPAQAPARGTRWRDLPVEAEIRASASSRVSQAARLLAPGYYALRPEDALEFLDECYSVHDKPPKPGGTARSRWCGSGGGRGWCSP